MWKYGERGFRYSMLDSGHAYGSLAVSAARLGWKITLLPFLETDYVEKLLGIKDANQFVPDVERERGLVIGVVDTSGTGVSFNSLQGISTFLICPNYALNLLKIYYCYCYCYHMILIWVF